MLAIFIQGGGSNAAQFAPGQHRLKQVAGIHRTLPRPGSDDSVQLIDKQHDLPVRLGDFVKHRSQAVFKLTAIFGTRNQPADIQRDQLPVFQRFRHVAVNDALGQAFGDRCFADTGLPN